MKLTKLVSICLPLALGAGCMHHRNTVAYTPAPAVVTPTSSRPVERVYAEPVTIIATPAVATANVMSGEQALADNIRRMFEGNPALAAAARGVRVTVLNSRIVTTGFVLTEQDRWAINNAIGRTPGVHGVYGLDDRMQVE